MPPLLLLLIRRRRIRRVSARTEGDAIHGRRRPRPSASRIRRDRIVRMIRRRRFIIIRRPFIPAIDPRQRFGRCRITGMIGIEHRGGRGGARPPHPRLIHLVPLLIFAFVEEAQFLGQARGVRGGRRR